MRLLPGGQGCLSHIPILPTGARSQEQGISFWDQFQNFTKLQVENSPYEGNRVVQERGQITTLQRSLTQFSNGVMLPSTRLQGGERAGVCLSQLSSSFLHAHL